MTRSGFVALAGRPNAGKSTLVNRIVGDKVAIVSDKPQTTRRQVRGIATTHEWQLVLIDLPGVQRPRDSLTERMQHRVEQTLRDADAVLFVVNGAERIGPGDRFIARAIEKSGRPAVVAVNKIDRLDRARTVNALEGAAALGIGDDIFPTSAKTGRGLEALTTHLAAMLPEGPYLYPPEDTTDMSEEVALAELIREQVLLRTRDELPHAVEVVIEEMEERPDGSRVVRALVWAETESQKGILIGAGGQMIKAIGSAARREMTRAGGRPVHLDLRVRVRRGWRRDDGLLDRLGIE
ncbi:MAG: GTPase Era [Thermoleophilaceae bacterium]